MDSKDRLWVGGAWVGEVLRIDASGKVIDVVGRKGRGPGEYLQVTHLDESAEVVATRQVTLWRGGAPALMTGVAADGRAVIVPLSTFIPPKVRSGGWAVAPTISIIAVDGTESDQIVLTGRLPYGEFWDGERYLRDSLLQSAVPAQVAHHGDTVISPFQRPFVSVPRSWIALGSSAKDLKTLPLNGFSVSASK
ncbi:MAG: hypothetical protein IIB38_09660 [Candidatus Hydrogenedentes bacterium]|nr:hypothetical protein [Candidatus Hydrogenedentota bacterium]